MTASADVAGVFDRHLAEMRTTGYWSPPAVACAQPHPIDETVLCSRMQDHAGLHCADENKAWNPEENQ